MAEREREYPDGGGDENRRGNPGSSVTPVGIRLRSLGQVD